MAGLAAERAEIVRVAQQRKSNRKFTRPTPPKSTV
jgi:hypothetical protein